MATTPDSKISENKIIVTLRIKSEITDKNRNQREIISGHFCYLYAGISHNALGHSPQFPVWIHRLY
ncbi:hypothetical protein XIS1_510004 [Xenorhabdus innexi]|uniref:Uncharacterized protein n=1 Tax=Xenorhabdus innexi TaxID=290109 RepID=A0A1N6MZ25_9GAMM|nr:hypothetical protein XIS1_510004 [Xenorhabdus innexi]